MNTQIALGPPQFIARPDGLKLAYHFIEGTGPTLIFLPGYMSDMLGSKAEALAAWAQENGRAMLRFDYSGCGESEGQFEDGTLDIWREDTLWVIQQLVEGPVLLIGSSMGGWLALLVAEQLGSRVAGMVGIAAAPDFTDWGFTEEAAAILQKDGLLKEYSEYGPDPMVTTLGFWQSGAANRLLNRVIQIDCPVHLLQGQADPDVPWKIALKIMQQLRTMDVTLELIKDGDHRLSRDHDIARLLAATKNMGAAD